MFFNTRYALQDGDDMNEEIHIERRKAFGEVLVVKIYDRNEIIATIKNIKKYFKSMRKRTAFGFEGICDNCGKLTTVNHFIFKRNGKRRSVFICEECEKRLKGGYYEVHTRL